MPRPVRSPRCVRVEPGDRTGDGAEGPHRARWAAAVAAVVVLGLAVRVVYVLVVMDDLRSGLDSIAYRLLGGSIRNGTGYVDPTSLFAGNPVPTAAFPPLYPAYQALWQVVFGTSTTAARLAGLVPAMATIALTAQLGRRTAGPAVGLVAGVAVALHPGLVAVDGSAMSENLTVPLALAAQLTALSLVRSPRGPRAAVLGLIIGLGVLTRQDFVFLGVLLVVWLVAVLPMAVRPRLATVGLVAVGAAVVVGPWVIRNQQAVEVAAVSTLSPSSALAGANCPTTYDGPDLGSWDFDCVIAARPPGSTVDGRLAIAERDLADAYRQAAVDHARRDPSALPRVVAAREARAWSVWDPRDLARRDAEESRRYGFQLIVRPIEAVLAVVGMVGLVRLVRGRGIAMLVLVAPVAAVCLSVAIGYGNPRFGATAQPSLTIAAVSLLLGPFLDPNEEDRVVARRSSSSALPRA